MHCASIHRPAGHWPKERATGSVTLDFDARHRRRIRLTTDQGEDVLLDLPKAVAMADGDALQLEDGRLLKVEAAAEAVVEVRHKEPTLFRRPGCEKVAPAGQFEAGVEAYNLPSMTDGLSTRYQDLLYGSYDCVDRIVLNAYFRMGHSPGGFRVWWRALTGSDETLENSHPMRLAGRFSRRIRGYAKAHGIPVIDCSAGQRKHELAEEYLSKTTLTQWLSLVLVGP